MAGYETYLHALLAPLGVYDLTGDSLNGGELYALGQELDLVMAQMERVERESLTATAEDEGLTRREELFARRPAATTPEERRAAIAALRIIVPEVAGVPAEFEQIQKIILDILPCHLEVEFYFRYLTWEECEAAGMTWASVEAAGHTWESFELAVPPETGN